MEAVGFIKDIVPEAITYDREAYLRRKADPEWRKKQRKYDADAFKRNPEKFRKKWRKAYQLQKTHRSEYRKVYRQRNLKAVRAKNLKWQQDNWTHRQEYIKDYNRTNNNKLKELRRKKYQKNRTQILAAQKLAHEQLTPEQRGRINARQRDYYRRNREREAPKRVAYSAARRFLKSSVTVDAKRIKSWMEEMRRRPFCSCYYCKSVLTIDIHFDHVVALKRGGKHEIGNLCVSCPFCNLSKNAKSFAQWPRTGQMFLSL